jgi:hypothetical protein
VVLYTMFEMFIVMQNQQEGKKKSFVWWIKFLTKHLLQIFFRAELTKELILKSIWSSFVSKKFNNFFKSFQ